MVKEILDQYHIDHLHYIAPMANIPSIFARGILSYNRAQNLKHVNVSMWQVQERRDRIMPGTSRPIHDYVPLYFATHTPTQRVETCKTKRGQPRLKQEDLVYIEIDAELILSRAGVFFADGNAASNYTLFYSDIEDLDKLDWKIIRNPKCYSPEYIRKKAAEVLIPNYIPTKDFLQVKVYSNEALSKLQIKVKEFKDEMQIKAPDIDWSHLPNMQYLVDSTHYYSESEVRGHG